MTPTTAATCIDGAVVACSKQALIHHSSVLVFLLSGLPSPAAGGRQKCCAFTAVFMKNFVICSALRFRALATADY